MALNFTQHRNWSVLVVFCTGLHKRGEGAAVRRKLSDVATRRSVERRDRSPFAKKPYLDRTNSDRGVVASSQEEWLTEGGRDSKFYVSLSDFSTDPIECTAEQVAETFDKRKLFY